MQRFLIPLAAVLSALVLASGLGGCVTADTSDNSMAWRVQSLETGFLEFQEEQRRMAGRMEDKNKDLEKRLAALEAAVAEMGGHVAVAPAESAPTPEPEPMVSEPMVSEPMSQEAMAGEPADTGPVVMAGPESAEAKPWDEVPGEPQASATTSDSGAVYASQAGPQQLYKRALDLTLADKSSQARPMFQEFLKKYPNHELAPNALYWLGETYYADKNYPQAILAFKDVSTKYPNHDKMAAALLKIGMSYRNVGDVDNAIFYLRTLVDEHPDTEPARLARQVLKELAP